MAAWMGRGPSRATWAAMLGMIPLVVVLGTSGAAAATGPKVDSFKVSNSSVGSADAKIVLTAKVTGAKTCTFSAAPHLAGLPKTVNCSSGKAKQAVTVPANSSTSPRSWVITLTVKGSGHKVTKTKKIRQAGKALSWGTQLIDPAQGIPNSVSCPTASFCVEVDDHGLASTSNGSSWSALKAIDLNSTNVLGYNPLLAVSCATTTFCVAVDEYGHAVTFNGKTWSTAKNIDAGRQLLAVSCPTTTFCAAVDGEGHALTYNGSKWSTPAAVGPDYPIVAVSCHSATFCVAVTQDKALTYNGTKWSGAQAVPTYQNAGLTAISCPTATFCVAADAEDEAFTDTSGTWSSATVIGMELDSLSCPTATSCIGVDDLGDYVSYNGATWSSETNVAPQVFQSVSCPTTTFCTVVDYGGSDDSQGYLGGGHALTFNGTTWSAPKLIDNTGGGGLTSVSCPTTAFCAAVDKTGHAVTYNGKTWTQPTRAEGYSENGLFAVSCASKTYCVAVDGQGNALTYSGTAWSSPELIDNSLDLSAVSCPTSGFCAAVDHSGNAVTYSSGGWSNPISIDPSTSLTSVSCPTASFCVTVDSKNRVIVDKSGSWGSPKVIDGDPESDLTSVSCVSSNRCVAIEHYGPAGGVRALVYNGSKWTKPATISGAFDDAGTSSTVLSCATKVFCDTVGPWGSASYNAPRWTHAKQIDKRAALTDVSCPTDSFCVAVDSSGRILTGTL